MKTLLKILIPIVILAGGSWAFIITITVEKPIIHKSQHLVKRKMKTNSGEAMTIYYYQQPAFNKNGEENRGIKRIP